MRISTMASIAILAISSAALAQVASSPGEQKSEQSSVASPDKQGTAIDNAASVSGNNTMDANGASTAMPMPRVTPSPHRPH